MIDITRSAFSAVERWADNSREHEHVIVSRWVGFPDDEHPDLTAEQLLCVEGVYPLDPYLNGVPGDYHAWKMAQQSAGSLARFRRDQVMRDERYEASSRSGIIDMVRNALV